MSKVLIVLQENQGITEFPPSLPTSVQNIITTATDQLAENFEDMKTTFQADGRYDIVHLLTDDLCSRKELLDNLVIETLNGRTIDLVVLGHGGDNSLSMKVKPDLTGGDGNIRNLLIEAKGKSKYKKLIKHHNFTPNSFKFNLRMVYMCNCRASSLNDDWLAIGAKASVGSKNNNYMPEPVITLFLNYWLTGKKVKNAAKKAYENSALFFTPIYPPTPKITYVTKYLTYPCPVLPTDMNKLCKKKVKIPNGVKFITNSKITDSELIVAGDGNLVF